MSSTPLATQLCQSSTPLKMARQHWGWATLTGIDLVDRAMEVAGSGAYRRGSIIERAYRDVRGAKLHPFTPEQTLVHAGRLALSLPCDVIQS
jgi:alkylation response protein AidB-like acyl-CoA dehydrogenase